MAQQQTDKKITHLPPIEVRVSDRVSSRARPRMRHWGGLFGLLIVVVVPVLVVAGYLLHFAKPQYASEAGFVVRQAETGSASQMLGGLSQMLGQNSAGHSDLLFEFIQSPDIVQRIQDRFDLVAHYSADWPEDPVFSIPPDVLIEDLVAFWHRMVRITYDKSSGVIRVQVRARDPVAARAITTEIVHQSEAMINTLNAKAREDSMTNAEADLLSAAAGLRQAREALLVFQARTQILDPIADIQGRMGVMANLQEQLAQSIVDFDFLTQTAAVNDPRLRKTEQRIAAIEDRIVQERQNFASRNVTGENTDYPTLLSQYEAMRVDVEFAAEAYRAALAALGVARTQAARQQLYLAIFVQPTLAQQALYPKVAQLIALTAFFALMLWSVLALVYYSLRDRG